MDTWVWCFTHDEAHRFGDRRLDGVAECLAVDVDAKDAETARARVWALRNGRKAKAGADA